MTKRRKIVARTMTIKPEPVVEFPVLQKFNLEIGDPIRFRKPGMEKFTVGTVRGDNKDGSITIGAGMFRSIMPQFCQRKVVGPRGGVIWEDLIPSTS